MRESIRNAALARLKLLEEAIAGLGTVPKTFIAACSSQGTFAQLQLPSREVMPLSLNALKNAADQVVVGGWTQMDKLRLKVLNANGGQPASASLTVRTSKSEETERMRILVSNADRARLRIARAYMDLLTIASSAATRDKQLRHELERHRALWAEEFGGPPVAGDGRPHA